MVDRVREASINVGFSFLKSRIRGFQGSQTRATFLSFEIWNFLGRGEGGVQIRFVARCSGRHFTDRCTRHMLRIRNNIKWRIDSHVRGEKTRARLVSNEAGRGAGHFRKQGGLEGEGGDAAELEGGKSIPGSMGPFLTMKFRLYVIQILPTIFIY